MGSRDPFAAVTLQDRTGVCAPVCVCVCVCVCVWRVGGGGGGFFVQGKPLALPLPLVDLCRNYNLCHCQLLGYMLGRVSLCHTVVLTMVTWHHAVPPGNRDSTDATNFAILAQTRDFQQNPRFPAFLCCFLHYMSMSHISMHFSRSAFHDPVGYLHSTTRTNPK